MRSPVVVGRAAELAVLQQLVDATAAGAGGAVLVAGEAGIGKSRLLGEVARQASAAGLVVLTGRAVQGGGTYRAVVEALIGKLDRSELRDSDELRPYRAALGRLLPGWADGAVVLPDVDQAVVLGEGLVRLLGAQPCLLRLEDLHWADGDTLALVEHLAGAVRDRPVLVAVSARDDAPAGAVRRLAAAPGMTTLRLQRLGAADIAEMAAACRGGTALPAAEVDRLVDRSDGVPFLVEELIGRTDTAVPPTLAGLVGARIATLDTCARDVITAAAVVGGEPDWRLLAAAVGIPEREAVKALRSAADVALLVADGERLRWPHALTRDAVIGTLLPPERAELARNAAEALEQRAGPDDEPRAAELFADAGELERASGLLVRLARRATARGAVRSAEQLLARAAATRANSAEVTIERVDVLTLLGRADEAIRLGDAALGGMAGDAHAELCLRLARAAVIAGRWAAAEDYVERAGRPDEPRSLVLLADAAFGAGRSEEADALATAAVESAERAGAHATLCEALGIKARTGLGLDLAAAIAASRRAARVAAEHGLTPWRAEAMASLAMAEGLQAEQDPAAPLRAARELVVDAGMLAKIVSIDIVLTDHVLTVDGPAAAEPIVARGVEAAAALRLPGLLVPAELLRAGCVGIAGDVSRMDALIEPVLRREDGNADAAAIASTVRAFAALHDHDIPRAAALADAATGFLLRYGAAPPLTIFGVWALLRTAVGQRDAEARAQARGHPSIMRRANWAALGYADAIAAGRAGRAAEAEALFVAADAELVGLHWWRRLLRLVALEAAITDGWGDPAPALRADLAEHERSGDTRMARTCRDLLRQAGQPIRRGRGQAHVPPELRALGVTSREVDVLELVAQGLTNAQVAARLYLSPRTIDTHVASLLGKLGAASRAELRGLLD